MGATTTRDAECSSGVILLAIESGARGKIKLLEKMRNESGMLLKTKDRAREALERARNVIETKRLSENPGML